MRFNEFWADVLSQNSILRFCLFCVGMSAIGLSIALVGETFKGPLIIERECFSRPIAAKAACDASDKIVGLKGSKISGKALNIAGSIGLGFVGGMTDGLQETHGEQGVQVRPPTIGNALLNATSATALEQSKNLMSDLKDRTPIIEVPEASEFYVLFGASN
jgi:hypothetical protein